MAQTDPVPSSAPLGAAGEHCAACGAALAADQRYCLNCGVRRAESRVPFPESLNGGAGGASPAGGAGAAAAGGPGAGSGAIVAGAAPVAPAAKAKRSWADRDLLLPVLGTALLAIAVGILIGRSGASDTINTKAPVVNVTGSAGTAAAAPTDTTANASTDAAADAGAADKTAKAGKTTREKAAPPANVSKSDLQNTATGKDYVNKSKKLPTEVSLGGTAPPKDNKPAGGGAEAETIG